MPQIRALQYNKNQVERSELVPDAKPQLLLDSSTYVVHFATTTLSGSKVMFTALEGYNVPAGAILDVTGKPTTNHNDFIDTGAHLPFELQKGFGIMLAIECLGSIFTGADDYAEANRGGIYSGYEGVSFVVMTADCLSGTSDFLERGAEMLYRV